MSNLALHPSNSKRQLRHSCIYDTTRVSRWSYDGKCSYQCESLRVQCWPESVHVRIESQYVLCVLPSGGAAALWVSE